MTISDKEHQAITAHVANVRPDLQPVDLTLEDQMLWDRAAVVKVFGVFVWAEEDGTVESFNSLEEFLG